MLSSELIMKGNVVTQDSTKQREHFWKSRTSYYDSI